MGQRRTLDDLGRWLTERGGIAHRDDALSAGFSVSAVRAFVRDGHATSIRRAWLATDAAPGDLRGAAEAGGRVSCTDSERFCETRVILRDSRQELAPLSTREPEGLRGLHGVVDGERRQHGADRGRELEAVA